MKIVSSKITGLEIIKFKKNRDKRGYLAETYRKEKFGSKKLIFDYFVFSKKNVLRGFHFQYKNQQAKYITVLKGKILDCVIDLRKNSKTFGVTFKINLSEKNGLSLFIPKGFAHSYLTLAKENIVCYKLSDYYKPRFESGIVWNDKDININWPVKKPLLSKKDDNLPTFKTFVNKFKGL